MLRLLAPALAILILAAGSADAQTPNYYPLGNGHRWEYQVKVNEKKYDGIAQMKAAERDKKPVYELEMKYSDVASKEELFADESGVYRAMIGTSPIKPALKIIRYPVKPGKWADTISLDGQESELTMTQEEAVEIQVPAGKYKAVPVKTVVKLGDATATVTTWFAENIGIVKQTTIAGDSTVTVELTKFTPGK